MNSSSTMKAVVYIRKKLPEGLIYREVEKPVPNDDEVLVKVVASSVNAADYRSMKMGLIPKRKIFGADVAGIVESAGKNTRLFGPGDEVVGDLFANGFGGFSEYALASEELLVMKPSNLSFEDAATLPVAGVTALNAIRDKGNIQQGKKVLILGSGGGVGTFAVQLARYFGAEVTAVCSPANVEQTKSLGADHVIDYTKEDFTRKNRSYDLILAINGNYSLSACKKILNPDGKYVMVGGALSQIFRSIIFGPLMSMGNKKIYSLSVKSNRKDLELIIKLAEDGKIRPVIEKRYPLEKTADAIYYLSKGHARGKVVITVD